MSSNLMDLAERVEAATGPDRELDALIEIEVVGFPERAFQQKNAMRPRGAAPIDRMEWLMSWGVLRFTASIDAAITLIPEGWVRAVDATAPEMGIDVELWPEGQSQEHVKGTNEREALATCAAALRARSSQLLLEKGE